mmetsp:Transcript_4981/g.14176  ORF Transcript_4981/g.14176 Transcript_4981/m.14176 type:complete len:228 (+) Transcript_4981:169-852(+)
MSPQRTRKWRLRKLWVRLCISDINLWRVGVIGTGIHRARISGIRTIGIGPSRTRAKVTRASSCPSPANSANFTLTSGTCRRNTRTSHSWNTLCTAHTSAAPVWSARISSARTSGARTRFSLLGRSSNRHAVVLAGQLVVVGSRNWARVATSDHVREGVQVCTRQVDSEQIVEKFDSAQLSNWVNLDHRLGRELGAIDPPHAASAVQGVSFALHRCQGTSPFLCGGRA